MLLTKTEFAAMIGKARKYVYDHIEKGNIILDESGNVIVEESLSNIIASNGKGYDDRMVQLTINIPISAAAAIDNYAYIRQQSTGSVIREIIMESSIVTSKV